MTAEQIERLREGAENHLKMLPSSSLAPDILALLAAHDRYRDALIRVCEYIEKVHTVMPTSLHKAEAMGECAHIARILEGKEALCE